uniref:G-protein coupled receptors family 3 profile domain-containing protein n=1 Tax=Romanomermis culicivorax TaxID=13658 RepID=A0A915KQ64_ROMCU
MAAKCHEAVLKALLYVALRCRSAPAAVEKAMSSLEEKLRSRNVCIGVKAALPKDSDVAQNDEYDKIVDKLLSKKRARGVVIYGSDQEVQGLVRALSRKNATNKFTFIGSDGWSARALVYEGGYEKEVLGTISLQPQASPIRGFREYFENLTVESNVRNPWFYEMWESEFKCRYPNKPETIYNRNFSSICTGREHKNQPDGRAPYEYEQQLQFVSDATLVFAYALRDYFRKKCNNNFQCIQCHQKGPTAVASSPGAEAHDQEGCEIDGELLKSVIQSVTFESSANQNPSYEWVNVGTWEKDKANRLTIDYSMLEFFVKNDEFYGPSSSQNSRKVQQQQQQKDKKKQSQQKGVVPASYCSEKCKPWEIRIYPTDGDKCCYKCSPCPPYQHKINENQCQECPNGTKPSENVLRCVPIPEDKVQVYSSYGIICLTIAILGTASTVFLLVIFLLHNSTPIVRASGRELSYVIIFGLFLCFAVTPITLVPPSPFVCGVQRFLSGFCFTVVYAAILTKTNRIARIFKSGRRTIRRPHFISPESQLFICGGVSCLQILLIGLWLYSHPPQDVPYYPTRKDNMIVCQEAVTNRYLMAYVYPIFLCIVCTVYAYKTRKMPEAFNESHYIGAAVYTTCVIWLAFVPVYIVSKESNQIRVTD